MRAAVALIVLCACGGEVPPPSAPLPTLGEEQADVSHEPTQEQEEPVATEPPRSMPTRCADEGVCTPPADFVERLCATPDPNVALAMFQKGSPWARAYLRRDMEAWYVNGHRQSPKKLRFGEEVIIVADRNKAKGGVQVSGSGSYDVYRWDGSCVSLMSDEVSLKAPTAPEVAAIPWQKLDSNVQQALERDERIGQSNEERRKACKEADEKKCERAHLGLSRMIAEYVRAGGELPPPKELP